MAWFWRAISSSIGKKFLVALTGLGLCGFLVTHLLGNFLLYRGQELFDGYAKALTGSILIVPAEIFLALLFGGHIAMATRVTLENRKSRDTGYRVTANRGAQTLAGTTMIYTGLVVGVFLVIHILNFRLAEKVDGSLYRLVVTTFQDSFLYVVFYSVAMTLLGVHLSHGFQSALQTLGLRHPRFDRAIQWAGYLFSIVIAVGFCSIPIYIHFFMDKLAS